MKDAALYRFCVGIIFVLGSSAFGADPVLRVQSIPHPTTASPIAPDLIQGIAGIGQQPGSGFPLPCYNCDGAPAGTLVLPPAYSVVNPLTEPSTVYYYVVETGNISGAGTSTIDLIEATTGRVWQHVSFPITLPANSTSLLGLSGGGVPNHDGYKGAEILVFTTTLGSSSVQGRVYLWMQ